VSFHVGVTGTRYGMSDFQKKELFRKFGEFTYLEEYVFFHFGDCTGVDAEAFELASKFGFITVSHPPVNQKWRAHCKADITHYPMPYLVRNQDIVDSSNLLIVVPKTPETESPRSGAWATYRMAAKARVKTLITLPGSES
jgi:hypothetical protein